MLLGDLEFTVEVDDEPLEEFDFKSVEIEGRKQVTCFIASETGKPFKVYGYNDTDDAFAFDMYMDGRVARESYVDSKSSTVIPGIREDRNTLRPFIFGSLEITDDDAFLNDPKVPLADLGTIRMDVYRVSTIKESDEWIGDEVKDIPAIHERSKKAGGHCVHFGVPIQSESLGSVDVDYIDKYPDCPYARFIFTYRSQEILQAQGIAPAKKTMSDTGADQNHPPPQADEAGPSTAGSKRPNDANTDGRNVKAKTEDEDEDDLSMEELLAEQAAIETRIRKAREREVKREPPPIALGPLNGEVIDLTNDD